MFEDIFTFIAIILVILVLASCGTILSYRECDAKGGTFKQSQCIVDKPLKGIKSR